MFFFPPSAFLKPTLRHHRTLRGWIQEKAKNTSQKKRSCTPNTSLSDSLNPNCVKKKEVMGQRAKVGQRSNCRFSQSFGRHEYETSSPHCSTPICRVRCWVNLTLGLPYVVSTMSSVAYQCFIMKVCMAERGDIKHQYTAICLLHSCHLLFCKRGHLHELSCNELQVRKN